MDKKQFIEAIKAAKTYPTRKFKQSFEFIMNLKELDLKKLDHQVELWIQLPHDKGRKTLIGAIVGPELAEQAKASCDVVITHDQFPKYAADKKAMKKLAGTYDYFIAQANIMPDIAKVFGRVFGPRGKMPNPKAGCVVPANANLKVLAGNLRKTIKVSAKLQPSIKAMVGKEDAPEEQIAENMLAIYSSVLQKLPHEAANIKTILLKLSMSPPVKITEEGAVKRVVKAEQPKTEKKSSSAESAKEEKPKKAKKAKKTEGSETAA